MMRCATLMPSPMMFIWPLMSFTRRTGPRLMPMRTAMAPLDSARAAARSDMATNRASSGSPRNVMPAPSPVSRTTRSRGATLSSAELSSLLNACLSTSCSATGFAEYSTMSRNTMLQTSVRLGCSIMRSWCVGAAAEARSFYAHARERTGVRGNEEYSRSVARGGEHHAFGDAEFHGARSEVGDHHGEAPLELRRLVGGLDAGEHLARGAAEIERQPQQLVGAIDALGAGDSRHAQVELVEVLDADRVAHGRLLGGLQFRGDVEQRVQLLIIDPGDEMSEGMDAHRRRIQVRKCKFSVQAEQLAGHARGRGRQQRGQVDRQRVERADRIGAYALQLPPLVGVLGELPGLVLVERLVDEVGEAHDFAHHLAELPRRVALQHQVASAEGRVPAGQRRGAAELAVEVPGNEARGARGDVDVLA